MKYGFECSLIVRFELEFDEPEDALNYSKALEGYNDRKL